MHQRAQNSRVSIAIGGSNTCVMLTVHDSLFANFITRSEQQSLNIQFTLAVTAFLQNVIVFSCMSWKWHIFVILKGCFSTFLSSCFSVFGLFLLFHSLRFSLVLAAAFDVDSAPVWYVFFVLLQSFFFNCLIVADVA